MRQRTGILVAVMALVGGAVAQMRPLTITTSSLPNGVAGSAYDTRFVAEGGRLPYAWKIVEGDLPPGMELDARSGALQGIPTSAGEFHFSVALEDASQPRNAVQRKYTLVITAALTIQWERPPQVTGEKIRGSLVVANQTGRPFEQTVIVLAVNQDGKAFALGYQHFTLNPRATSPPIPFESSLPYGTYVVHADAVAEVPAVNTIHRARLQTEPMVVQRPFQTTRP
ncbi:MAG: Ig domain-containing protein [Acidobacteriaceae bacterium]